MTRHTRFVTCGCLLALAVTAPPAIATFPDAHEAPPTGWKGPVFKLSQDYPAAQPPAEAYPWKQYDFQTQPEEYVRAVLAYALEGNTATEFRGHDNPTRLWYHAPWMHYGDSGREFIHGMTRERNSRPKELAPNQTCYWQNWAVGMYNAPGGYVIGQVWSDPINPNASRAVFPDGTVSVKVLFTSAPEAQVPYLKNGLRWEANIDPLTGACTRADPTGVRKPAALTLLQIDVAVRDTDADHLTGWVMGTFVYDGTSPGATPWERMIPVGLQWGNDPALTPADYAAGTRAKESWINPALQVPQHLGWLGRLNGPVDNPLSSCLSCHSTGQDPQQTPMVPPGNSTDAERMRWFRNVKTDEPFDASAQPPPTTLAYSLQLSQGIQNLRTAGQQLSPAIANGVVIMMTARTGARVYPVSREEGPDDSPLHWYGRSGEVSRAANPATAQGATPGTSFPAPLKRWSGLLIAAFVGLLIGMLAAAIARR